MSRGHAPKGLDRLNHLPAIVIAALNAIWTFMAVANDPKPDEERARLMATLKEAQARAAAAFKGDPATYRAEEEKVAAIVRQIQEIDRQRSQ